MYYNARWYDPALGRFTQADTLIPGAGNPLAWDRYMYTLNNPLRYRDTSGHCPTCLGGAVVGGLLGGAIYAATTLVSGREFSAADLGMAIVTGVAGGALIGTGLGASAGIATFATIGAGGGLLSAQAGYSIASGQDYKSDEMLVAATVGAVSGAVSGALGAPTSVNPLSGTPAAYAVQGTTNFVAGAAQYIGTQFVNGERINLRDAAIVGGVNYWTAGFADGLMIDGSFSGRMVDKFGMRFVREKMTTRFMKAAIFDALSEGITSITVETIANNFPVLDHLVDKVMPE